jgi:dipeptidase E
VNSGGQGRYAERSITGAVTNPTIVALGGGGFQNDGAETPLDDYILELGRAARGRARPRVCFVPTASGDSVTFVARFYEAFARRGEASHLALFDRDVADLERFLLEQDIVYVGGGNTANLLAVWRVHGLDVILRRAWEEGVVLAGRSAGSICWFEGGTTDSFGDLAPLRDGLGFLTGSNCPHYDGEAERRPLYHRLVATGELPAGYAADDGVGLVFRGTELAEVVSERAAACGYRVERGPDGRALESALETRFLG